MHKLLTTLALTALCAGPAFSAPNPARGTADTNTPATTTCMGSERALMNSNGSPIVYGDQDRTHGGFGQLQADFVAAVNAGQYGPDDYGQWLQDWKAANCS